MATFHLIFLTRHLTLPAFWRWYSEETISLCDTSPFFYFLNQNPAVPEKRDYENTDGFPGITSLREMNFCRALTTVANMEDQSNDLAFMPIQRTQILTLVLEQLREIGEDLEKPELLDADETTRLFGARSALESINLVNLIADLEESIHDDLGVEIILANQIAMSRTHSPFRKVGTCVDYIMELINQQES